MAAFGAEPSPLSEDVEEGVAGLLDWLLQEFEFLVNILSMVSNNTAVLACESVSAVLSREGCPKLDKITACDYAFPTYSELEAEISRIQVVKKAFLRRFWKVSRREIVREVARKRLEESFDLSPSFARYLLAFSFFFTLANQVTSICFCCRKKGLVKLQKV